MSNYTVETTPEQEEVLQWEASNQSTTALALIQGLANNLLAQRKLQFDRPSERLKRLSPTDKSEISLRVRKKLGLE